jgi:DNA mismatch endonuclease, patch repair protein
MPDIFSKHVRSRVMASIKSKGNSRTELRLANIFRRNRFSGWRRHPAIPGNPDFVISSARLAIFVDGCFWHGCPKHGRHPTSNTHYWLPKLERTLKRDRLNAVRLRSMGWAVLRLWEHELDFERRVMRKCRTARLKAEKRCAATLRQTAASQSARKSDHARPKAAAKIS